MLKPAYINIREMGKDALDMIENYLNGLDLANYELEEICRLCPILIDVFNLTWTSKSSLERDPLEYRVYCLSVNLISDAFSILDKVKDQPELTTPAIYSSTIRSLSKLKKAINTLTKNEGDFVLDSSMTEEEFASIGLNT